MTTKQQEIEAADLTGWTDAQLRAAYNLADFDRRALVIGERVFVMLEPKVAAEMRRRGMTLPRR